MTTSEWQPYREPLRTTLVRTLTIAVVVGAIVALMRGGLTHWPFFTILILWPSVAGHWVEIFFLNWLRPRIPSSRGAQVAARLAVWFVAGFLIAWAMHFTAAALTDSRPIYLPPWWLGGLAFIGVELVAHAGLQLGGKPSFYNGRG